MLKIIQDTLLKSLPIDSKSANLPKDFQSIPIQAGTEIDVKSIRPAESNHLILELKSPQLGRFNWYVFNSHVQIERKNEIIADIPIDWKNPSVKISKYFSVGEVTKNDSRRIPIAGSEIEKNILSLAKELDKIREEWDSAIIVTSWYRPPSVNKAVGGAVNPPSRHIFGQAVDIKPANKDLARFQSWLDQFWFGALGYGANKGFVHVDQRNGKGWRTGGQKGVRWNY